MFQTCTLSEKAYWLRDFVKNQYATDVDSKSKVNEQVPYAVWESVRNLFIDFYI